MGKITTKQVFKSYSQGQAMLLPPDLNDLIPVNHLVRVVDQIIEKMDISVLINSYQGGGTSAYHPRMLLKILLYAYAMKIYTGRKIAKALREDINFMWLSALQRPDFRTINLFRSGVLKISIEEIFKNLTIFLLDHEYIKLENYFCDGSTFSADANKYKMIWKKNAERNLAIAEQNCKELFKKIDDLNREEEADYGRKDLEELGNDAMPINLEAIESQGKKLSTIIEKTIQPKIKRKAAGLRKKLVEEKRKISKYHKQIEISDQRSGYSKTDNDATAMRMKNEEVLPAYNVLIGAENQFITHYSIHQNSNDGQCFKHHIEKLEVQTSKNPANLIADSVFGIEENYELLEKKEIKNYLKFPTFHPEQKRKHKNNPFTKDNFPYNAEKDVYICPFDRVLRYKKTEITVNKNGYESEGRIYECESCSDCRFTELCKKSIEKNRTIKINTKLEQYRQQSRDNLNSEQGIWLRKKRSPEVESCFGDIKHNQRFRRFHVRGKQKAKTEFGILAMSHNLRKVHLANINEIDQNSQSNKKSDGTDSKIPFPDYLTKALSPFLNTKYHSQF